jgi:Tfp pilus assembly protein PilW
MASFSLINAPDRQGPGGFTLLEVMLATFITAFVFAGVLSAYIFLGRGLTRQANEQQMESGSRVTLFYFAQDVALATTLDPANISATSLSLYSPDSSDEITYTYNASQGTLVRTTSGSVPGPASLTLLHGLSAFSFNYYNFVYAVTTTAPPLPPAAGIKEVNLTFTLVSGAAVSGAQATLAVASPRVAVKNKMFLGASPGLP